MPTTPAETPAARPARGRRAERSSGDERQDAILRTAERLLAERPLGEISIDDLAQGAGISRPTFYFYFPSKAAVVLTLFDRTVEETDRVRASMLERLDASGPGGGWRESIEIYHQTLGAHRPVIQAAVELSATNPEARALRSQLVEGWVADVAARIQAERDRGAAPPGPDARELATALVQMNENVLRSIFVGDAPSVSEDSVVDVLDRIWHGAIYAGNDIGRVP